MTTVQSLASSRALDGDEIGEIIERIKCEVEAAGLILQGSDCSR